MVYQLESPDINTVINYCKDLCANDNDMREEIQARFDAALEDGKDELDVYSEMLETGIDKKMVRKNLGDDAADHMKDFCKEHGLI